MGKSGQNQLFRSRFPILGQAPSLLKFVLRLHQTLETGQLRTTERLLIPASINMDETSFRVNKKNHWLHVYTSDDITPECLIESEPLRQ